MHLTSDNHVEWKLRPDGWVEVSVEAARSRPMCVVGYDTRGVPATTAGLILPEENSVFVNTHFRPTFFRADEPDFSEDDRTAARTAVHTLRAFYGFRPCVKPTRYCTCDLEVGPMWRWFQACDAHVVSSAMAATMAAA